MWQDANMWLGAAALFKAGQQVLCGCTSNMLLGTANLCNAGTSGLMWQYL